MMGLKVHLSFHVWSCETHVGKDAGPLWRGPSYPPSGDSSFALLHNDAGGRF